MFSFYFDEPEEFASPLSACRHFELIFKVKLGFRYIIMRIKRVGTAFNAVDDFFDFSFRDLVQERLKIMLVIRKCGEYKIFQPRLTDMG